MFSKRTIAYRALDIKKYGRNRGIAWLARHRTPTQAAKSMRCLGKVPTPSRTSPVRDPAHDTGAMRNVTSTEAPNLFTPELFDGTESLDIVVAGAEKSPEILARDFVQWCWSFGTTSIIARTSRIFASGCGTKSWTRRRLKRKRSLLEARRLFLKKVEQAVRKADVPKVKD